MGRGRDAAPPPGAAFGEAPAAQVRPFGMTTMYPIIEPLGLL